jgi:Domain of unknown function (DUF4194)
MTSDTANGADPAAAGALDLDEWGGAEGLDGIDAGDGVGDGQATDEYGFGFSLWDGDEGTLEGMQRDALVVLLKQAYISSDTYPREWKTLVNNTGPIRSQLNNLYLDLVIDEAREIAYKRSVRSEDRTFRTLLYDTSYNREETLLLVFLREQFRAEGAAGATHVFVDADAMQEYVARFRPAHDTDELGGRHKVENAIKALKKARLITPASGSDDRYRVSRAIETLLPVDKLRTLLAALRKQNTQGAAAEADSDAHDVTDAADEAEVGKDVQ